MKRIVSGIQPSNQITLGNYLGAIKQFVELQNGNELFIFVADLHCLTNPQIDFKKIADYKKQVLGVYLASGLVSQNTVIFCQSDILHHNDLAYVLLCNSTMGELSRMTQFKDKSTKFSQSNKTNTIPTGIFTYPTLMAADILLYDADFVPVGIDQKQHLELTRTLAERMNKKYGEMFKVPEPYINPNAAKIMDLNDPLVKMSKSNDDSGTIFLLEDPNEAFKKILKAKTDNLNNVKFDIKNQPGISNLITIYANLAELSIADIESKYVGKNYYDFKQDLAKIVAEFLTNFQSKYNNIIHSEVINELLTWNTEKCNKITTQKMKLVYERIGIKKSNGN